MKLKSIKKLVAETLKANEVTRGNDDILYLEIIKTVMGEDYRLMTIGDFFQNRKLIGVPNFESVRRCRQKVQAENPSVRPNREIAEGRRKSEEEYYDFF